MQVIMINGKQGSGKTTTAKALVYKLESMNEKVIYNRFASVLYQMHDAVQDVFMKNIFHERASGVIVKMHDAVREVLGKYLPGTGVEYDMTKSDVFLVELLDEHFSSLWFDYDVKKIDGPLLQKLGTEWGRNKVHENIWVLCMQSFANIAQAEGKELLVIDDMRFPNEFHAFEAFKVRLDAPEEVRKVRAEKWRDNTQHPSEVSLDEYAQAGKFDLYVDTHMNDTIQTIEAIVAGHTKWKTSQRISVP